MEELIPNLERLRWMRGEMTRALADLGRNTRNVVGGVNEKG